MSARTSVDPTCGRDPDATPCRRFTVNGTTYTVQIEWETVGRTRAVKRVRMYGDPAGLLYEEVFSDSVEKPAITEPAQEPAPRDERVGHPDDVHWALKLSAEGLEDSRGWLRAILFSYEASERAGTVPHRFVRIVAPRGSGVQLLVPSLDLVGEMYPLPDGSTPGAARLLEGDRFIVAEPRGFFAVAVPYHVDLDCEAASPTCVTVALSDSIAGLARFDLATHGRFRLPRRWPILKDASVELFAAPGAEHRVHVTVERGDTVTALGAAGRILAGGGGVDGMPGDVTKDDWLHIQVKGQTGWINGARSFRAIGLRRLPEYRPGSPITEM